ncbi:testicular acid phosphatase homolog isoform X1 [Nomia melanderi]|uniref:testicular acid phosphatase homolog isoform X1 n=2 Tax=Nomia melanderi TaxID=2448451 RepID=UPI0013041970|nr:testicular acid phosphatase homolog isoform X1 [Nomia melanderi]XP_031833160.1 testicular acid phosphatase homolog isoform X1 [Nomia melanderi]XP_031833161.1 testicular acid phosphatase homolog isoform X1 [Nomia melanderi]XP_031833162.1 testicular acid phosphatase homolog isoform X1 [Nomia melanderi]XP_031833164.1 testicular acid phosphatase homolog isoform X1 [Nomia melanderi]XP_031833165.1 testicular acid phosphatase homolog isoform X1 [Nomia melanderi]
MLAVKLLIFIAAVYLSSGSPVTLEEGGTNNKKNERKTGDTTLRLVVVVMRHGERAPQDTYPNDPYLNDSMEPYGWGQLTNEGRRSQYNQGLFLRNRYDDFLGPIYSPEIFYLQSTAVDRTKMSALLEAAALWKPNEKQSFKADLPWQPVTLFYQPRSEDTLMLIWDTCPKYTKLRRAIMSLPEVQKIQSDNTNLYNELTNLTGMAISSPEDVNSLYGTLTAEKQMNLTLPEWTDDYYPDKMEPLTLYDFELNVYNDLLRRLKGGPFLKKIVTDMLAKKDNTIVPEHRKMFMYIGHDSTVVTLLDVMHVWNNQMPHYNIMTMIELHEDKDGWNVQVFLRNTTNHEPYSLTIPGCVTVCPLDKFIQIMKPMIPDDWKEECKVEGDYTPPPAPVP